MTTYFFGWLILFDQLMFDNWFFGRLIFLKINFSPVNASFIVLLSFKGHILSFCPLQDCFLDHLFFSSLLDLLWKTNTPTFKEIFHQLTVYSASPDILKNLHLFPPPNFFFSYPLGRPGNSGGTWEPSSKNIFELKEKF